VLACGDVSALKSGFDTQGGMKSIDWLEGEENPIIKKVMKQKTKALKPGTASK
jgi:hypothetical protein